MSLNKVMLIGNVGQDPTVRYLDTGVCVATFSLATTERGYSLPNGTQVPDRTEWHNIVVWRKQAEFVEKYVRKGDRVFVEGKIQSRSYDDKQGVRRYVVEIMTENLELLTSRQQPSLQPSVATTAQSPAAEVVTPQGNDGEYPF